MIKEERADFCSTTLTLLIYEVVTFPNIENFVYHLAVEVFLTNNPESFLLADFYHTFQTRHEKRGVTFLCCVPLLHLWMRTHMPKIWPFAYRNFSWPQSFIFISASSILWYKREWETKDVIFRCGVFPIAPLIWTRGCINYIPVLLKR